MEDKEKKRDKIIKIIIYALFIYIILNLLVKELLIVFDTSIYDSIKYYYVLLIPLLIIYIYLMIKFKKNKIKKRFLIIYFILSMCIPVARMELRQYGPSSIAELRGDIYSNYRYSTTIRIEKIN